MTSPSAAGRVVPRVAGRVVVVGGGLAGLTAAVACADAGAEVVLLEGRPRLGGATSSFRRDSPAGPLEVDTGQHVFLRCCTAYRALLDRLGVEGLTTVQRRLDVPVLLAGPTGPRVAGLARTALPLPAPLHLAPALLGYRALPLRQRLQAGLTARRLGRLDPRDPGVDATSFGAWLAAHGVPPAAVTALWELLTVATLNAGSDDASLALAATVVRTGLLTDPGGGDIGWSDVPLSRLHADPAAAALSTAGAQVHTRAAVRGLRPAPTGWTVATDAGELNADAVVLAVPPERAAALLPAGALPDAAALRGLGSSPIVNVHVVYDRPVHTFRPSAPFLAVVGSPVQWVFDRTRPSGLERGQYLALSQSAAADLVDTPVADVVKRFQAELARLLPAARDARVVDAFVTRERAATFRQAPGSGRLRPGAATALPGLALAGTWTDTGWPATMEGAVRSGRAAADVALRALAEPGAPRDRHGSAPATAPPAQEAAA